MALTPQVRRLLTAPNYVHLHALRPDGAPRGWVVWVGLDGDRIVVCTGESTWKARSMRADPRVSMTVVDLANPYEMASIRGRVVDAQPDEDCRWMDPISHKYTGKPFPMRGPGRVAFFIEAVHAEHRSLPFAHDPA